MQKIAIDSQSYAIYLDHAELINQIYAEHVKESSKATYKLNSKLFDFHAKNVKSKSRKRSASQKLESNCIEDNVIFQRISNSYLQLLNKNELFQNSASKNQSETNLQRYWEDRHEFPQFYGVNETNEFQKFLIPTDNSSISYIIPPNCKFFNHNIENLTNLLPQLQQVNSKYDFIILDPPWRNKYIRRLKKACKDNSLSYHMLYNDELENIILKELIHEKTLVAIWCTNSAQHQEAIINKFLPAWNLRLLHQIKWLKLNTSGQPISSIQLDNNGKQPYEMLYFACHQNAEEDFCKPIKQLDLLFSIPSIIHSHKPPLLPMLQEYLPKDPKCLELFARYLQPNFTSIGLEVLKLMDERLYIKLDS